MNQSFKNKEIIFRKNKKKVKELLGVNKFNYIMLTTDFLDRSNYLILAYIEEQKPIPSWLIERRKQARKLMLEELNKIGLEKTNIELRMNNDLDIKDALIFYFKNKELEEKGFYKEGKEV